MLSLPWRAVIPPGHKVNNDGDVVDCDDGEYYPEWRKYSATAACTPCGTGIHSDPVEPLETFTFDPTTDALVTGVQLVRRTTVSCCECLKS
jgi:hypothetical protein